MNHSWMALALAVTLAASGCGGSGDPHPSSGGNRGLAGTRYKVVIRGETAFPDPGAATSVILPDGGVVTSGAGGIDCGVDAAGTLHKVCSIDATYATTVVLTATPRIAGWVHGWAGACGGTADTCSVFVDSDRFAAIRFAATTGGLGAHSNFADPAVHVREYMRYGQAAAYRCTDCHGATLQGSGLAPACTTCHPATPAYPPQFVHPTDGTFASPAAHGPGWVSSPSTCAACHGGANLGGTSWSPSCTACHPAPHLPGARNPPRHNDLYGAALTSCAPCHEATWAPNDVRLAKSCNGCHTMTHPLPYPPADHGSTYVANTDQCRYCHSTPQSSSGTLNGGLTAPSCAAAACHSTAGSMPHAVSYSDPVHGAAYVANPLDCKGCHGADLGGATPPLVAPSCSGCHITPHDVGAMAPPAHTDPAIAAGATNDCTACHEAPSQAKLAPSCMSCHQFTHPLNWSDTAGEHGWQYGAGQAVAKISCEACHGGPALTGGVPPMTAPTCAVCHTWPVPSGNHFLATEPAWGNYGPSGWAQACQRCHVSDGFRDYIGGFWLEDTAILGDANNTSGSFVSSNTTTAGTGLAGAYATGTLKCQACHNPGSEPTNGFQGITQIRFPSMNLSTVDKVDGLCGQCHQGRGSTPGVNAYINGLAGPANQGVVSATFTATGGTVDASTSTLDVPGLVAGAYRGFTAIFAGNVTPDLNGTTCTVASNTATTLTLGCVLPVAPGAETFTLYPTATGGTTTTLVDANRTWSSSQWVGRYVYFYNNKGLFSSTQPSYARITASTPTSLTFAGTIAPSAGQLYEIIPNEAAEAVDAQLSGASYQDPHDLGAAATFFGGNAAGYYEYPVTWDPSPGASTTKTYLRLGSHSSATCTSCHDAHALAIPTTFVCGNGCHNPHLNTTGDQTMAGLRLKTGRWYIDNGADQGVYQNYVQMMAKLYTAIQRYSLAKGNVSAGTAVICFTQPGSENFVVGSAEGQIDGTCPTTTPWGAANSSTAYTPRLLRAVHNYKMLAQDPGAWAHNPRYVTQIMYDAIRDLNMGIAAASQINMTGWTRPP
jgi:hypothetical protein